MITKITHGYDLSGMAEGDWFLGCPECEIQYGCRVAALPVCWNCGQSMMIYDVTKDDVEIKNEKH